MPTSTDFDLTLMICLLRNLAEVDISDILPNAKDTSEAASLSRLKYYRNQVVHSQTFSLSDKEFKQYWDDITNVSFKTHYWLNQYKKADYVQTVL